MGAAQEQTKTTLPLVPRPSNSQSAQCVTVTETQPRRWRMKTKKQVHNFERMTLRFKEV